MYKQHAFSLLVWLFAAGCVAVPAAAQENFQVVIHADRDLESLTAKGMSRLFLKKDKTWPDGAKVRPIDQPQNSPVRLAFLEGVHDLDEEGYARYWVRLVFAGRAKPPEMAPNDTDVLQRVQQDPNAIGYVSASVVVPAALKVVAIAPASD